MARIFSLGRYDSSYPAVISIAGHWRTVDSSGAPHWENDGKMAEWTRRRFVKCRGSALTELTGDP